MSTSIERTNISFSFPYEYKQIEEGILPNPRITIELKGENGFFPVKFLVDTGADVTTLPLGVFSPFFHFKINIKDRITISGVEGKGIYAYPSPLTMRLKNNIFTVRSYFIESSIEPLLGRLDFWNLFSLTFDNHTKKTIIFPIDKH